MEEKIEALWEAFEANSAPFATLVAERSERLDEGSDDFNTALAPAPEDECARITRELTPNRPTGANAEALRAALRRLQAQAPIAEERAAKAAPPPHSD